MSAELFIEVGIEEIPAGFLEPALSDLAAGLSKRLDEAGLKHGVAKTFGTPRRLAVSISDVIEETPLQEKTVTGPPSSAAFKDGKPTKAAEGFAKKQGCDVSELTEVDTERGKYVAVCKKTGGEKAVDLLPQIVTESISALRFKKTMRWGSGSFTFVRPIHWLVALFDEKIIPAHAGEIAASNESRGHRFMAPEQFKITGGEQYVQACLDHKVMVDISKRREIIREGIEKLGSEAGGRTVENEELVEETANLVEWPVPIKGRYDDEFLKLPRAVPETAMGDHQRYFAVEGNDGKLLPYFITISNMEVTDPQVLANGNERVLRARLADAAFFWREDLKVPLDKFAERLSGVVFLKGLGSSAEKVNRFRKLAGLIADEIGMSEQDKKNLDRAAAVCKADLETLMVYEFPELQGLMGREYAMAAGEPQAVADAIEEHYRPRFAGDDLPASEIGAVLSVADKLDTICGCFGVGKLPTGTADPLGLRRAALGVINIMLARDWKIDLLNLIAAEVDILQQAQKLNIKKIKSVSALNRGLREFFRTRFANIVDGISKDLIDAVLTVDFSEPVRAKKKIEALAKFKKAPEFDELAAAFKRVTNILDQAFNLDGDSEKLAADIVRDMAGFDKTLAEEKPEIELAEAIDRLQDDVDAAIKQEDYSAAFSLISQIKPQVDTFFDEVLVNHEDEKIRQNRLALLRGLQGLFKELADFSRIST
jgi:glycyl-tRNA synthetase beta chain